MENSKSDASIEQLERSAPIIHGKQTKLKYDTEKWEVTSSVREETPGLQWVTFNMKAKGEPALPALDVTWRIDLIDIQCQWHPQARDTKHLMPPWNCHYPSNCASNAPVLCLHNTAGLNRMTIAWSEIMIPAEMFVTMRESTYSELKLAARLCPEEFGEVSELTATLRVDTREQNFAHALRDVNAWWDTLFPPRPIPDLARLPVYSSWYVFHDEVKTDELIKEARLARELGCRFMIIDDGWNSGMQSDTEDGLGDWVPKPHVDMAKISEQLHQFDMKLVLWFATPFVYKNSRIWETLGDKTFRVNTDYQMFDFRYPETRAHILGRLDACMREFGLDGFKIDFIDSIPYKKETDPQPGDPRRDTQLISESIRLLLEGLQKVIREYNPDTLVEFRQAYLGPLMRQTCTMIRGFDCPQDPVNNRILTTDIRLLNHHGCTHSDMFIWNMNEPVEVAALEFANVLFSVPQLSAKISELSPEHVRMVKFYLDFWTQHRELLLDGEFIPISPEANYPALTSTSETEFIAALYNPLMLTLPDKEKLYLVNATPQTELAVKLTGRYRTVTRDCMGNVVAQDEITADGVRGLTIPRSGIWSAEKI